MNNQSPDSFGDFIREGRKARGLGLRELARNLEIAPSYLSDIENDRRTPSEVVLRDLSKQLHLNFDEIMAYSGRFGEKAARYIKRNPNAGALFRRIAEANLSPHELQDLLRRTEELERRRDQDL